MDGEEGGEMRRYGDCRRRLSDIFVVVDSAPVSF